MANSAGVQALWRA